MTTQTFADYVATQDARNTIQLNVRKWTEMLCEALEQNFVEESIKRAKFFAVNNGSHDEEYYEKRIAEIKEGKDCYKFEIETGRKYHKIVQTDRSGSRSVHAFVDKKTGEVYKAASFKAPAKHVRFNLCIITDREWLLENADWAGGYLYTR